MNWLLISLDKGLNEDFIREHQDKLHWGWICLHHDLSERMIEKFADKVDWRVIAECQNISLPFIEKHIHKLPFWLLQQNKHLTMYEKEIHALYKEKKESFNDLEHALDTILDGLPYSTTHKKKGD